jgi:1,4-dihydroxy-2-naphthoate octaprenyltransferase
MISSAQPLALLAGILFYALGVGIANYLGFSVNLVDYWLGQAVVSTLQLGSSYLKVYYDLLEQPPKRRRKELQLPHQEPGDDDVRVDLPRNVVLLAALSALTVGAVFTVLLLSRGVINLATMVMLGVAFVLAFFYAVPPLRLVYTGYGELAQAILVANLIPALAFLFQTGEVHRLLPMLTFPLTALYLAMTLSLGLPAYLKNLRQQRSTMLIRMGWQRGMFLHNLLIFFSYLLLGLAAILGLPWLLTWPLLLTLPLGLFLIWLMTRIAAGAPARWRLLNFSSIALVAMAAYLTTLALWTS